MDINLLLLRFEPDETCVYESYSLFFGGENKSSVDVAACAIVTVADHDVSAGNRLAFFVGDFTCDGCLCVGGYSEEKGDQRRFHDTKERPLEGILKKSVPKCRRGKMTCRKPSPVWLAKTELTKAFRHWPVFCVRARELAQHE